MCLMIRYLVLTTLAICQQIVTTLDRKNISIDNGVVNKLFKKGTKGDKKYVLSEEELIQ